MDTFTDNHYLAEYIANRLAGKSGRITLRIREPIYQHTKGMTMKTKEGFYIDINPKNPPLDQLKTFYHELAHIYMGHLDGINGVEALDRLPPRYYQFRHSESKKYTPDDHRQEKEADLLGGVWYTYAEKNYHHYGADLIENRLAAVLEWAYL